MRVKFAKNLLEKCNPKEDSSKATISYLSVWHVVHSITALSDQDFCRSSWHVARY